MDVLLITTRRSAPATSKPPLKAVLTMARSAKRKSATTNDPRVRIVRSFLRFRLAHRSPKYFMLLLPQPRLPAKHLYPNAESHWLAQRLGDRALLAEPSCRIRAPGARSNP